MCQSTLVTRARIVDTAAGVIHEDMNILLGNGRIEGVSKTLPARAARTIDASHAYVCPGLIDAHVHLFLDAGPSPRMSYLAATEETRMRTATRNAQLALHAGITTVRDCGGPADLLIRLQRAVDRGQITGPRILSAGSPLTRVNGHCGFFGIEVSTPEDVRRAVDQQAREGAVLVKLIASGGGLTPGTRPSEADLPVELMHEAVAAARRNGMHVSAHCHAVESIVRAIESGVSTIEHASFVRPDGRPHFDPAVAARIRDQGIAVCPTSSAGTQIARAIRERGTQNSEDDNAVARLESRKWHTGRFYEAGVKIIAGTDCGVTNTPFDSLVDELGEYVAAGISPLAALRAATCESALHLNQPLLGRIEAGCFADLIFVNGDPLENVEHLRRPALVMKEGEIVCDFRPAQVF